MKKPLPPAYLTTAIAVMLLLHLLLPWRRIFGSPERWLGLVPLAAGAYLNLAADRLLKVFRTTVKPFQESAALVTTGVYGISRHPMYLGFLFLLLGAAILLGSVTPFLVVVSFPFLLEIVFIRTEEKMLRERFGREWSDYAARVRRWL